VRNALRWLKPPAIRPNPFGVPVAIMFSLISHYGLVKNPGQRHSEKLRFLRTYQTMFATQQQSKRHRL
jgi:hypothetical protein